MPNKRLHQTIVRVTPCASAQAAPNALADEGSEAIFNGRATKKARKACPIKLWRVASRKLDQLDSAEQVDNLKIPPGNRLELLSGKRRGQHSIRINEQYRICFIWSDGSPHDVEIVDYH